VAPDKPPARRASLTGKVFYLPQGAGGPKLGLHLRLGFYGTDGLRPCELFLTPSRSAAKHGSLLHARCEDTGMLVSWLLQRGMTLEEMGQGLKGEALEGLDQAPGLALFAVRAALELLAGEGGAA
jgi:hypothetical protein